MGPTQSRATPRVSMAYEMFFAKILPIAIAALALISSGCARRTSALYGLGGSETEGSARRAARFEGDACSKVYYHVADHDPIADVKLNERKFPQAEDASPATQILLATCARFEKAGADGEAIPQRRRVKVIDPEALYLEIDDRRLDILTAAVSSVVIMNDELDRYQRFGTARQLGLVLFYTSILDREEVAAAVGRLSLPVEAKSVFLKQYDHAVRRIRVKEIGAAAKKLLMDVPVATFRARQEHYKKYAALYAELDGLQIQAAEVKGDAAMAERLIQPFTALRSRFMAACREPACRNYPIWAEATKTLALLHVARKAGLDAEAESTMQWPVGRYMAGLPQAIRAAQNAAFKKMLAADERFKRAKADGADEETAKALAGPDYAGSVAFNTQIHLLLFNPEMSLPNFAKALDEKVTRYAEEAPEYPVLALEPAGPKVKISFEKNPRLLNPVDLHAPVFVPAAEAKSIQPKDIVMLIARGEEARVLQVRRGEHVIQIRADAVGR